MEKEKGKSFNDLPLVRAWGLEPQRITAREPKSRMSTNSIMPAYLIFQITHRAGNEKTFTKEPFRRRFNSPPFLLGEGIRGGAYRLIRVYKKQEFLFLT